MLFKQYTFIYLFTYQKGLWVELTDVVAYHQLRKDKLLTLNMSEFVTNVGHITRKTSIYATIRD